MAVAKAAGTWTYEDLFSLPDDRKRYEIIEGNLYELPSPNLWHATVLVNLVLLLGPMIRAIGGKFFPGPVDVFFPGANPVIPDILIVMPGSRTVVRKRGVEGPPDLVIEVLSPSNRGHDLVTKRALYSQAGVREYWIVDPAARSVEILTLHDETLIEATVAQGEDEIRSPLLDTTFSLTDIFAEVGDNEIE
jgi:Uma2 family endonuclease